MNESAVSDVATTSNCVLYGELPSPFAGGRRNILVSSNFMAHFDVVSQYSVS